LLTPSPSFLIDPKGEVDTPIRKLVSRNYDGGLPHLLGMFDSVATVKERLTDQDLYSGESMRRITWIKPDSTQQFLAQRTLVLGQSFHPETTLLEACLAMQDGFSTPVESSVLGDPNFDYEGPIEQEGIHDASVAVPMINSRELFLPDRITNAFPDRHMCIEVDFLEGLSIPQKNVPLEEILRFKERNTSEYEAFWDCLRGLAADVEYFNSPKKRDQLQKQMKNSLGDYETIMSESWGRRVVNSAKFNFVLDGGTVGSFTTVAAFQQYFGTEPLVLIAGTLGAVRLSLNLRPSRAPLSDEASAMSYISELKRVR